MQELVERRPPPWRPGKAALAGLGATAVYSLVMALDQRLSGNHFSDVRFIEGLLGPGARPRRGRRLLAWGLHLLNGVLLGEIYAALVRPRLPGPTWLKGLLFGEGFLAAVWWLTPLADRFHPLIRRGELPRLASWPSFGQNVLRHLAFGLALALLYGEEHELPPRP
uniref:DUF1440 domain-containing protein n=1 Tax=Thermogemmatispora argillosa TaxID=2045280 RepID=A0A455T204_9CHLR|nr:hypothetical protein KTA_14610 [Thermogemmatispora argillosa]